MFFLLASQCYQITACKCFYKDELVLIIVNSFVTFVN